MKKTIAMTLLLTGLVGAGYTIWGATKPKTETLTGSSPKGSTSVYTMAVEQQAIPLFLDAVGTVEADQSVAIRPEVGGVLQKIHFREGDLVKAGQLLFQIDPSVPQADVEKARATLARDQATLAEARAQAQRLAPLAEKEYITRQEYAQAAAQEATAAATVRADEAALKTAQILLERTQIYSPIAGRAGVLNIKLGNLVNPTTSESLVLINGVQSVMVVFSIPQQHLQSIRTRQRDTGLTVEIRHEVNAEVLTKGTLVLVDNTVDPQTGTIKLKARIPNPAETIWPGELVAVRLIMGIEENVLVVPETAVQPGQEGSFVYVADGGKARMQTIEVARQAGTQIIVSGGLEAGQQVIVNAPKNLRPGGAIKIMNNPQAIQDDSPGSAQKSTPHTSTTRAAQP